MSNIDNTNINTVIARNGREKKNTHKSVVLWFTGLSGSGKSTLAYALEEKLQQMGCSIFVLDSDDVRYGLSGDLTFSDGDQKENIRRMAHVSKLLLESGVIVLASISLPCREDRLIAQDIIHQNNFYEIYCDCLSETREERDVKALYLKGTKEKITNLTRKSSHYGPSHSPEIVVFTDLMTIKESVDLIIISLVKRGILPSPANLN